MKYHCLNKNTHKWVSCFCFCYLFLFWIPETIGETNAVPKESLTQAFSLNIILYSHTSYDGDKKILGKQHLEGLITRTNTDPNLNEYELSVKTIRFEVEKGSKVPNFIVPPFNLKISANKKENILLFQLLGEKDPNSVVVDVQHRLGFTVFEMAMLDVISEKFEMTEGQDMILETEVFNYYDRGHGKKDIRKNLTGGIKITTFKAVPVFREKQLVEYFLSDLKINPLTLEFCTRKKDVETGRITHAVDLKCAFKEKPSSDDISSALQSLDSPKKFNYYYFYELAMK